MNNTKQTPSLRDELDNYRRLVELQSQIVELAQRNNDAERLCRELRKHLAEQTLRRSPGRIRQTLTRLLERVRNPKAREGRAPRPKQRVDVNRSAWPAPPLRPPHPQS